MHPSFRHMFSDPRSITAQGVRNAVSFDNTGKGDKHPFSNMIRIDFDKVYLIENLECIVQCFVEAEALPIISLKVHFGHGCGLNQHTKPNAQMVEKHLLSCGIDMSPRTFTSVADTAKHLDKICIEIDEAIEILSRDPNVTVKQRTIGPSEAMPFSRTIIL